MRREDIPGQRYNLPPRPPKHPIVYLVYCTASEKIYVGATTGPLVARWASHLSFGGQGSGAPALQDAIRAYGPDAFELYIIEEPTIDDLGDREKFWIQELRSTDPERGYNILCGNGRYQAMPLPAHRATSTRSLQRRAVEYLGRPMKTEDLEYVPDHRCRLILEGRFLTDRPTVLRSLAAHLGLSIDRVRQLQVKGLRYVKNGLRESQPQCDLQLG